MIKTDNLPLMDNVVHYVKRLALECILKNEYVADNNETVQSRKNYDLYKTCLLGNGRYEYFDYTLDDLMKTSCEKKYMYDILVDKNNASEKVKSELLKVKMQTIVDNYVELNNYYRMLNGLPDIEDKDFIFIDSGYLTDDDLVAIDVDVPVHLMSVAQQDFLYSCDIMDDYISKYPEKKYLNYLGSRKIDPHIARNSPMFSMLYMPKEDIPMEVYTRWQEKFNINRVYTIKTVYDREAFIDENEHYEDFILMFIVIQTMVDIIAELPDFIIKRDIFDLETIRLILQSYDIDYFPDIPLSYQQAIVRNINKLVEFKSTERSIVNICSLFGCDNITVFKYYLFKCRKLDDNGQYIFNADEHDNYDLKFIKCPIDENIDDHIHDKSKYRNYNDATLDDKWWDGGLDHEEVKRMIIDHEFNYLQSKYYSIDAVFSMTELLFQLVYFYNMIFDDIFAEELLRVRLFNINTRHSFKLVDVFCFLFALGYVYYGLEDNLIFDETDILYIKGFNFDVDMSELASYINDVTQGLKTIEDFGVQDFSTLSDSDRVLSFKQLSDIFINNKKIYHYVVHELTHASNKRIYDIYRDIFDAMMINELTSDFFVKSNGEVATSFTDFLKDRSDILYDKLMEIKDLDEEDRKQAASTLIDDIIYVLEHQYLTDEAYKGIYKCFPTGGADSIILYIKQLIEFFKSYKMQLEQINIIYLLDDKYENWAGAIDNVDLLIKLIPGSCQNDKEKIRLFLMNKLKDKANMTKEEVFILSKYVADKAFYELANKKEVPNNVSRVKFIDEHKPWEILDIKHINKI